MSNDHHHVTSAADAVNIVAAYDRWREAHCVTIMHQTMESIRKCAVAGRQSYLLEDVGANVDFVGFIDELTQLGYKVRAATKRESRAARSIVIEW